MRGPGWIGENGGSEEEEIASREARRTGAAARGGGRTRKLVVQPRSDGVEAYVSHSAPREAVFSIPGHTARVRHAPRVRRLERRRAPVRDGRLRRLVQPPPPQHLIRLGETLEEALDDDVPDADTIDTQSTRPAMVDGSRQSRAAPSANSSSVRPPDFSRGGAGPDDSRSARASTVAAALRRAQRTREHNARCHTRLRITRASARAVEAFATTAGAGGAVAEAVAGVEAVEAVEAAVAAAAPRAIPCSCGTAPSSGSSTRTAAPRLLSAKT